MKECQIKNLKELLMKCVGANNMIENVEVSRLSPRGENYLSLMLKVVATLKDANTGERQSFNSVAKCISEYEFSKSGFSNTFRNELHFYTAIIPALQSFLKENGLKELEFFPKFIAARNNLHGSSDEIDENAMLILENLKANGYANADRFIGFNFECAQLVLKDLAAFHAVPLALKLQRPTEFEEKIRKYCVLNIPPPPGANNPFINLISVVCEVLEDYPICIPVIPTIKKELIYYSEHMCELRNQPPNEPFGTLSHFDMWVNNTMQKISDPMKNAFVDFQMYLYESPVHDLIFCLLSSVQLSELQEQFDFFVKFYHKYFIQTLEELGCNTTPFEYEKFLEEFNKCAASEVIHVLFMLFVIFGKKGTTLGPNELPGSNSKKEDLPLRVKDKMAYIVELSIDRGWFT